MPLSASHISRRIRIDDHLALHRFICAEFGYLDMRSMLSDFSKNVQNEELSDDYHPFIDRVKMKSEKKVSNRRLVLYGQHIHELSKILKMGPSFARSWKPHQYLALLFTERYFDLWFENSNALCDMLNEFASSDSDFIKLQRYNRKQVSTLAYQSATGSGKTLIMHANLLQYRHYMDLYNRKLNAIYLLTPDVGMSLQHLREFSESNIFAQRYRRDAVAITSGGHPIVQIIEINNLKEESKDTQVAVSELGMPNLVLVDEGHLGAGSDSVWRDRRTELALSGFTLEYSATFNQIAKEPSSQEKRQAKERGKQVRNLFQLYSKCMIFDYSYKHYYHDGYGKEFSIANLKNGLSSDSHRAYQVGNMLAFYQQMRIYAELNHQWIEYNAVRPLWVILGNTVTTSQGKLTREATPDILEIIDFLSWVLTSGDEVKRLIAEVLDGAAGLQDSDGNEWVADKLQWLQSAQSRETMYDDLCQRLFHGGGQLHLTYLTHGEGEIHLSSSIGGKVFGVINVGDAKGVYDLVSEDDFGANHLSLVHCNRDTGFFKKLFADVDHQNSPVNLLVGARKFIAGWNSWRVSTMTLLNVGRAQGPQVVQMFGRGVRLKGFNLSLKRHKFLDVPIPNHSDELALIETLNVYGLRANYMETFRKIIQDEDLIGSPQVFTRPVERNFQRNLKLPILRTKSGLSFSRDGEPTTIRLSALRELAELDLYPRVEVIAGEMTGLLSQGTKSEVSFGSEIYLFDRQHIHEQLIELKQIYKLHNLMLSPDFVDHLLQNNTWYKLYMPPALKKIETVSDIKRREKYFIALARQLTRRNWNHDGWAWERENKELVPLSDDNPNFVDSYQITVNRDEIIGAGKTSQQFTQILCDMEKLCSTDDTFSMKSLGIDIIFPSMHAYVPILCLKDNSPVRISPVALNGGEAETVKQLIDLCDTQYLDGWDVYLMRNASRIGVGFFPPPSSFYPDFICWLRSPSLTHIVFLDPKGMVYGDNTLKTGLHSEIKHVEHALGNPNIKLHSYILSVSNVSITSKGVFHLNNSGVERVFAEVLGK